MSASGHLGDPQLLAYWSDDLPVDEEVLAEEHLMACETCSQSSARIAAVVQALRTSVPPIITSRDVQRLRERGVRIAENAVRPGGRITAVFRKDTDILLHVLEGLPLQDLSAVDVDLLSESTGERPLLRMEAVPFTPEEGRVLVACQRHFTGTPPDVVFVVHGRRASGREELGRFTVVHEWDA